jgi:hypothetical protein
MDPDTDRKIVEVYRTVYEPAHSEDGTWTTTASWTARPTRKTSKRGARRR